MYQEAKRKLVILEGSSNYDEWVEETQVRLILAKCWGVIDRTADTVG